MTTVPLILRWQCSDCGAKFFTETLLDMHIDNFHKKDKRIDNVVRRIRQIFSTETAISDETQNSLDVTHNTADETIDPLSETQDVEDAAQNSAMETHIIYDESQNTVYESESTVVESENTMEESQNIIDGTQETVDDLNAADDTQHIYYTSDNNISNELEVKLEEANENDVSHDDNEVSVVFVNNDGNMYMVQECDSEIPEDAEIIQAELVEGDIEDQTEGEGGTIAYMEIPGDGETVSYTQTSGHNDMSDREKTRMRIMRSINDFKFTNTYMDREVPSFPCERCDQVFRTKHERRIHLESHARDPRFFCKVCGRGFYKMALLRLHSNVHVEGKHHECTICHKMYRSEIYLKKHMAMHDPSAPPRYECGVCGLQMALRRDLRRHMTEHAAPPAPTVLSCSCCGVQLLNAKGGSRARCAECSLKFRCLSAGRQQYPPPQGLGEGDRPYVCAEPGCLKSFRHPGHLRRHHATHYDDHM